MSVQDQLETKKRPAAVAGEELRNRTKARKFNTYMAAKEGSVEAKEFKPVKDKLEIMKRELLGNLDRGGRP